MAGVTIKIEGLDEAIKKLSKIVGVDTIGRGIKAAALHVKGKVNVYPPSTIANSPSNPFGRWYERGFGPRWRTPGGIGGKKTSETLGRKWTIENRGKLDVLIGNNVSYGPYVHGPDRQARFMASKGWKTTKQVAEEETDPIKAFVVKEIVKEIAS